MILLISVDGKIAGVSLLIIKRKYGVWLDKLLSESWFPQI
jgi:hypothetical protein